MQIIDIVLLVLIAIAAYGGYKKGFVVEVITTIGWVVALLAGFMLLDIGMTFLEPLFGKSWWLPRFTYFVIFVATLWGLNYMARWVKSSIKKTLLGDFDAWAGGILGASKMVFALSIICYLASWIHIEPKPTDAKKLYIYPVVLPIAPTTVKFVMRFLPPFADLKQAVEQRFTSK